MGLKKIGKRGPRPPALLCHAYEILSILVNRLVRRALVDSGYDDAPNCLKVIDMTCSASHDDTGELRISESLNGSLGFERMSR